MFVIPPACEAFGRELPPVGTRVQYKVIMDCNAFGLGLLGVTS